MRRVNVKGSIKLDQFLKWASIASSGGQGKMMILSGMVKVNGETVQARGRLLSDGDVVNVEGAGEFMVYSGPGGPGENK